MAVLLTPTLAVSITSPTAARLTIGNVGVGTVNIEIERKAAGGSFALVETIGGSGTVLWDDNSLVDGTAWTWRVRLTDGAGSYGSYSSEESGTTLLPAADGLYTVGSPTSVDLHWTRRAQNNTGVKIWRTGAGGATFGLLYTGTTPSEVSYTDNTVSPGQTYKYYVETYNSLTSADSSEVSVFTADPPNAPTLTALMALGTTSLRGVIQDNSDNEEGFTWEWGTDGVTFGSSGTTGPNITTFDMTGLTSNQRYYVRVMATNASGSSAYSNVLSLSTLAAVAPPRLAVTPWGSGRIECVLTDCSELETDHRIERRVKDAYAYTADLSGGMTFSSDSEYSGSHLDDNAFDNSAATGWASLDVAMPHWISVDFGSGVTKTIRKLTLHPPEYGLGARVKDFTLDASADGSSWTTIYTGQCSDSATAQTFLFANALARRYWRVTVTSSWDTGSPNIAHILEIEMMEYSLTDYVEIATLEPNREFYPDTGLTAGVTYEYRARARQAGSPDVYSAYSDVVSATVLSAPDAPTSPAVSEYQDTFARLTWTKSASGNEAGYEIYKALSGGAFSLYRTVGAGIEDCRISGLAASTAYEFKVRAINAAGNSAYTSTVSLTTRSSYVRSKFEKLQLQTKPADWLDLIEINPTITLAGWALSSGKTYTYQIALSEPVGILIEGVTENGEDLDLKASIAEVEAAAGSFYFDYASQTIYVHPSGSDDPADYYYLGSFWMRFTTGDTRQAASRQPVVLNGKHYIPLVPSDGIPDITQTIQPQYQGDYKPAHGSVSLINGISKAWGNVGFFDKLSARYNWKGRRVLALGGRIGWSYQDFYPFSGGVVTSTNWGDARFTLTLRDIRELMGRDLPRYDYWESDFPNLDTNSRGKPRPLFYGDIVGYSPVCIDTVNRVFELNNGRISGSRTINVYQNDVALTSGTDCYIDYQRGRITLSRSLTYESTDKITADFTGRPDDLDAPIELGPMILLDLLRQEIGLALADIDLDSFYEAAETATTALVLPISKVRSLDSCNELIEKSCMGWLVQDNKGRLAFRLQQTSAPSGILYIPNARIKDGFASDDPEDNTYAGIDVGYAEGFDGTYQTVRIYNNVARWRDGAQDILTINTLVPTEAAANALGTSMAAALGRRIVSFEVDRCLYTATPGDLVYLSRTRYPSATGVAANVLCRVMSLTKSRSTGSTSGTLWEVA